jgi:cytochrome c553
MHRIWILTLTAALALCLLPALSTGAAEKKAPRLLDKALAPHTRPGALFDHDKHNEKAKLDDRCWVCHHMDGKKPSADQSSEGQACADCHAVKAEKGKTSLRAAYHGQCQTCHATQKTGPLACGECHKSGD